jgi:hypothetical protein
MGAGLDHTISSVRRHIRDISPASGRCDSHHLDQRRVGSGVSHNPRTGRFFEKYNCPRSRNLLCPSSAADKRGLGHSSIKEPRRPQQARQRQRPNGSSGVPGTMPDSLHTGASMYLTSQIYSYFRAVATVFWEWWLPGGDRGFWHWPLGPFMGLRPAPAGYSPAILWRG